MLRLPLRLRKTGPQRFAEEASRGRDGQTTRGGIAAGARKALTGLLAIALMGSSWGALASEYKLGPQDRVRVKVIEWRASIGETYEWAALTGEYTVNAEGRVFLPLIGEVDASGVSLSGLSKNISEGLKRRVGLVELPDTSVEIVQARPFYIIGSVERPGEYPYRTGLTVLQAVSVAGGFSRATEDANGRLDREAITGRGNLTVLNLQKNTFLARMARLQAEEQGSEAITFPAGWADRKDDPAIGQMMREENLIFESRRNTVQTQMSALDRLKALLQQTIVSLTARIETQDRQYGMVQKELKSVTSLVEKGLAVAPRQLVLERTAVEIEGRRLEMETAVLKAQQDLNRAERDTADLQHQRRNEIVMEMREVQSRMEEVNQKLATADRLLFETEVIAPQAMEDRMKAIKENRPIYALVRKVNGKDEEKIVAESAEVLPGDIIKVQRPLEVESPIAEPARASGAERIPTFLTVQNAPLKRP
ncbi:polysaccharide biosynthesis/export family protein [Microvirga pudoricolor]|uniref:polysaccharide biosynthesis/export family protein n=1 Tax=Microvirga pudoricolor TaxID=2778729 RepID=UPI00194F7C70|nr:polysaccharide biosynthesis/export family protein [Microvirga pudoricolor]MBM6593248.1 polysaccharide biosynthesis/export family protein [Microvirga pudoricolor]